MTYWSSVYKREKNSKNVKNWFLETEVTWTLLLFAKVIAYEENTHLAIFSKKKVNEWYVVN